MKGMLQRALLALYLEHRDDDALPTGGRFLWYELEQRGIVDKTKSRGHPGIGRGIDQDVTDALIELRKLGLIPWESIFDDSRVTSDWTGYPTLLDGTRSIIDTIHLNPWQGPPPIILSESRQTAGVLSGLAQRYRCIISGLGGHVNAHLVTTIVPLLQARQMILFLGDADLSGNQIEDNVLAVLGRHQPPQGVTFERLLLTPHQAAVAGIQPIEKVDKRYTDKRPHKAVELEAFGQRRIVEHVRERLDDLLPEPIEAVLVREQRQRQELAEYLSAMPAA